MAVNSHGHPELGPFCSFGEVVVGGSGFEVSGSKARYRDLAREVILGVMYIGLSQGARIRFLGGFIGPLSSPHQNIKAAPFLILT